MHKRKRITQREKVQKGKKQMIAKKGKGQKTRKLTRKRMQEKQHKRGCNDGKKNF